MKKSLFLACLIGILSTASAYSYTGDCIGGTIITTTAGKTFCRSDIDMNWWSAQNWCKANGSNLATMYEMCPNWDGNTGYETCPELENKTDGGDAWSATVHDNNYAFAVNLKSAYVASNYRDRTNATHAFCR